MRACLFASAVLLCFAPVVSAAEKDPPPGEPPYLWRASAELQDGKVIIQIARPEYKAPRKAVAAEAMQWDNLRKVTLGETVRALGVNGKPLEPKAVLKALAEPKCVAVFVRSYCKDRPKDLTDPDPYYLEMLREDAIVLVVAGGDIYPLRP